MLSQQQMLLLIIITIIIIIISPPNISEEAGMANLAILTSDPTLRCNEGSHECIAVSAL